MNRGGGGVFHLANKGSSRKYINTIGNEKPLIDLDELLRMNLMVPGFEPLPDEMVFYYDETNNYRKFRLEGTSFNSVEALKNDFILGGVAFRKKSRIPNVDSLIDELGLNGASELKFKNLSKSDDFPYLMGSNRISIFLQWLYNSGLYVNYCSMSNWYFALVDIVHSVLVAVPDIRLPYHMANYLKDSFYQFSKEHISEITSLLIAHEYPVIKNDDVQSFCTDLISIIESEEDLSFEMEYIRQVLKSMHGAQEMPLLNGNIPLLLVEDYSQLYLSRLWMFRNSYHIFDHEPTIESLLNKLDIRDGDEVCTRYSFEDSKEVRLIQVSDAWVGLLSKFFSYVNSIDASKMKETIRAMTPHQRHNLKVLSAIIDRSDRKCTSLLHSANAISEMQKRGYFLQYARHIR